MWDTPHIAKELLLLGTLLLYSWLMHANVILERLWESEPPIGPGHIERGTNKVVIRVVAEVWNDDRRDTVPVARPHGYLGITSRRCAGRARWICTPDGVTSS